MSRPARSPRRGRTLLLLVAVVAALSLAGCSALSGDDVPLPNGTEAAESYRSLDGYSATVTVEQSTEPDQRFRIWVDPAGGSSRSAVLAPPSRDGNVAVANETTIVNYNATTNEYIRISTSGDDRFDRGAQRIADAVSAAREDETTSDAAPVGGAPLPVVPDSGSSSDDAQFVVDYEGTTSVAGRTAYVLNYTAAGDRTQGVLQQKIWLDSEYFVTLKATQVSRLDGNRSTYDLTLSNVSFDADFAPERFEFDPPAGATLNESDSFDLTSFDSRAALVDATAIAVPEPAVPDRYRLVTAQRIHGVAFDAVQLQYRAGTSGIFVTKTTEQSYANTTAGEVVSIGGQSGRYRSSGVRSIVVWECNGYVYTVVGDVQKSTLLDVARSVACT